ncbi:hypothetical protein G6O67_005136 [Ophiocordyceps sinensis]|uniref:Uncharacterized protein n=1 Tax=Ophiocordyceps sinensis TaxID=72228 RepID=A0A8H4PQY0_9HYPO|nr:hypothetical protein G6O67_005136 [Ophiocordyceps sinensis]
MAHAWTRQDKIKRGVWAAAFVTVVSVGSLTGAQLKSDRQKKEAIDEFRKTSASEQIAILQTQKESLLMQRANLERKMALFRERVRERESAKIDRPK